MGKGVLSQHRAAPRMRPLASFPPGLLECSRETDFPPQAGLLITHHQGEIEPPNVLGPVAICISWPPLWEHRRGWGAGRGKGVSISLMSDSKLQS